MELPEGYRAEIIEGFIEVSPTGRYARGQVANRARRALDAFPAGGEFAAHQDMIVIHGREAWIPDVFITLEDAEEHDRGRPRDRRLGRPSDRRGRLPGGDGITRDRTRKRRAYARAGIPVYVLIDDHDDGGTVTVLSAPGPEAAVYADEVRTAYGSGATVPEGPAKGFTVGEEITGPRRGASRTGGSASRGPSRSRPPGSAGRRGRLRRRRG
ncbi:Uma2 family endonuclease [Streptomyces sp. M-16]|uniref:Uma2 family endonuclease n=1 Tax=Streptomyces sp. M-16 TaxID=3233040 RepID=UPI003F9593A6